MPRRPAQFAAALLAGMLAATLPAARPDPHPSRVPQPPPALRVPLADRLPALAELGSWRQQASGPRDLASAGAFVAGNGRVAAMRGLADQAATATHLWGPDYGAAPHPDGSHSGAQHFELQLGASTLVRYLAQRLPSFEEVVDLPIDSGAVWPC